MNEQIPKEIQALKETLQVLQQRISELERQAIGSPLPAPPAPQAPPRPAEPPRPSVPMIQRPLSEPAAISPHAETETLETRIGRYWLNRIGITSLVLGIAFFILYTFQYFGPAMKIATGFACLVPGTRYLVP